LLSDCYILACLQVKIPKSVGGEEKKLVEQLRELQVGWLKRDGSYGRGLVLNSRLPASRSVG
jgi:hypothetical protein